MDYEFCRDISGRILTQLSMGHEVIGYWLNEEINGDANKLANVEERIRTFKQRESEWFLLGKEYSLYLSGGEVTIKANQVDFSTEEPTEGMSYYDEESLAICGAEDFLLLLSDYRRFINE